MVGMAAWRKTWISLMWWGMVALGYGVRLNENK
jgi:hypothetical protein